MSNIIDKIKESQMKPDIPEFRVGDTVRVDYKIKEGNKERIQAFEGVCIARKGSKSEETFTVRKKSSGIGVERVWPVHSPRIEKITLVKTGKVRRAKLYYIRDYVGTYKIKERGNK